MLYSAILNFLILKSSAQAAVNEKTIAFNYHAAEIEKVISDYAAASGQRFVFEDQIKGRVTIVNPHPVSLDEAFNQLSSALAGNGQGIATDGETMHVMAARSLQRNNVPVVRELPPPLPERMLTWIYRAKYASVETISTQLRILTSRDGELVPYAALNQLLISDWTTNLQRIAALLREIDVPAEVKPH